MENLVLAAGLGTRLRPITTEIPKPIVELTEQKKIIDTHISPAPFFTRTCIITGYLEETIVEYLQSHDSTVITHYNPFYKCAGPIGSLWIGTKLFREDKFTIVNGDTAIHPEVYGNLNNLNKGIYIIASKPNEFREDSMTLESTIDQKVKRIGKEISNPHYESVGMCVVIGKREKEIFRRSVRSLAARPQKVVNGYWHEVINEIAEQTSYDVDIKPVSDEWWYEIDNMADLEKARREISREWYNG